jgi:hypothetical protein
MSLSTDCGQKEERAVALSHVALPIDQKFFEHLRQLAPSPSAEAVKGHAHELFLSVSP